MNNYIKVVAALSFSLLSLNLSHAESQSPEFLIPKKVHFVWMGNKLPHKYLNNIRTFVARNPDYEFNMWIDRVSNFEVSQALLDSGDFPIHFRNLNAVVPHLPVSLQGYFERERNGVFPNYAAASDIIRVQILLDEGGVYFDTDVFMKEKGEFDPNSAIAQEISANDAAALVVKDARMAELDRFVKMQEEVENFKYIKVENRDFEIEFVSPTDPDHTLTQAQEIKCKRAADARDLREPVSRLGNIYAPFGFLYNVETKRSPTEVSGHNNNVMAAVQNSYFLRKIQERMLKKYEAYEESMQISHAQNKEGKTHPWSPYIWVIKRYDPNANSRFDMTISLTGPGLVAETAGKDVYVYLQSLPKEKVDLMVEQYPELVRDASQIGVKKYSARAWIHDKHWFYLPDKLYYLGFKFKVPGFNDHCDNTWTQPNMDLKKKRSAEWN